MTKRSELIAFAVASIVVSGALVAASIQPEQPIRGQAVGAGAPIVNSTVTLWQANTGEARKLAYTKSDSDGRFQIRAERVPAGGVLYLTAGGGESKASAGHRRRWETASRQSYRNNEVPRELVRRMPVSGNAFLGTPKEPLLVRGWYELETKLGRMFS